MLTYDIFSFEQLGPAFKIRMGVDDNSEMVLLFFFRNVCSGPCLEPTGQDGSVEVPYKCIHFIGKKKQTV